MTIDFFYKFGGRLMYRVCDSEKVSGMKIWINKGLMHENEHK